MSNLLRASIQVKMKSSYIYGGPMAGNGRLVASCFHAGRTRPRPAQAGNILGRFLLQEDQATIFRGSFFSFRVSN